MISSTAPTSKDCRCRPSASWVISTAYLTNGTIPKTPKTIASQAKMRWGRYMMNARTMAPADLNTCSREERNSRDSRVFALVRTWILSIFSCLFPRLDDRLHAVAEPGGRVELDQALARVRPEPAGSVRQVRSGGRVHDAAADLLQQLLDR